MNVKQFKDWFTDFASGVSDAGTTHRQWAKIKEAVEKLTVEETKKVEKTSPTVTK